MPLNYSDFMGDMRVIFRSPLDVFHDLLITMQLCVICIILCFVAIVIFKIFKLNDENAVKIFGYFSLFFGLLACVEEGRFLLYLSSRMDMGVVITLVEIYDGALCLIFGLIVFVISRWGAKKT